MLLFGLNRPRKPWFEVDLFLRLGSTKLSIRGRSWWTSVIWVRGGVAFSYNLNASSSDNLVIETAI